MHRADAGGPERASDLLCSLSPAVYISWCAFTSSISGAAGMRDENEGLPFAFGPSAGFEGGGLLPSLLYAPGPGAVSEFPGQQVQWVGGVAGQQEVQPHAPWQQFHDATAQQLVVQVQPQGSWLHSSLSLDSGGGQQGGAQSAGRLDPATMAAKLASAREKNRAAQQRFRARQREKQKQAGEQCTVLQEQIDEVRCWVPSVVGGLHTGAVASPLLRPALPVQHTSARYWPCP